MAFGLQTLKKFFGKLKANNTVTVNNGAFWVEVPNLYDYKTGINAHYWSHNELALEQKRDLLYNYILLKDRKSFEPQYDTAIVHCKLQTIFKFWPKNGELIAGGHVVSLINSEIPSTDIDIYFKSHDDALSFIKENKMGEIYFDTGKSIHIDVNIINAKSMSGNCLKLNLIYSVQFSSAQDLISGFDIRACSIALDIHNSMLYSAKGAIWDVRNQVMNFNPLPHHTSVKRLIKYIEKGFRINDDNRVYFADLLKTDIYDPLLEMGDEY